MDEVFVRVRGVLANHGIMKLHDETRKLVDKYGIYGAELYLKTQMKFLRQMREREEKEGENFGDEL